MSKKVLLIDGHNLLFRMFYGIPSPIKNSKGKDIRALLGFVGSIKKLIQEFNPYSIGVIFDSETSKDSNLKLDSNYKANRIDYGKVVEEENPFVQLPLVKRALDYLEIYHTEVMDNEADDYIASITKSKKDEYEFIIVSTDKDFIQLVDNNTYLYVPRGKKSVLYDYNKVIENFSISPSKYVLYKSLVGDKSDNISGILGIGKITALKILKYNSIEEYIINNDNKISNLLVSYQEKLINNEKLITMNCNINTSEVTFNKLSSKTNFNKTYEVIEKIGER